MKHILGPDGLGANTRIGEGDVLRHIAVKMMRDHHHVEMLIDGVTGERHGRVRGTREHVGETGRADDVGRVAAARPFGVIGVDGPALECGDGVFDASSLIQGVRMDGHLHVHVVGDTEACVDDGRGRAPILVDLQSGRSRTNLLAQWFRRRPVAFAQIRDVHRHGFGGFDHAGDVERARRACGGVGAVSRPGAAADHGGDAAGKSRADLLRRDEMNMGVDATGGENEPFTGDCLRARADCKTRGHPVHGLRVAGLTDRADLPILDADIRFVDAGVIDDERVGDDRVRRFGVLLDG